MYIHTYTLHIILQTLLSIWTLKEQEREKLKKSGITQWPYLIDDDDSKMNVDQEDVGVVVHESGQGDVLYTHKCTYIHAFMNMYCHFLLHLWWAVR